MDYKMVDFAMKCDYGKEQIYLQITTLFRT